MTWSFDYTTQSLYLEKRPLLYSGDPRLLLDQASKHVVLLNKYNDVERITN